MSQAVGNAMGSAPSQQVPNSFDHSYAFGMQAEDVVPMDVATSAKDDSSDSSEDLEGTEVIGHATAMDSRCRQDAIFTAWANDAILEISNHETQLPLMTEVEEQMSLKAIMSKHEASKNIIASPRDYQMELFERAKNENTIAVLDTGSGKTLIAVLLLKHTLELELERRAADLAPRIAFFLVDKVMLCEQQFAVLSANLDFKVAQVHGSMLNGIWNKDAWRQNFEDNMVIVCTADVLFSCLVHSFIQLEEINLLVFDEAHHAKKGHAYARIIRDFYLAETNPAKKPRIFGTTASPIDVSVKDMESARSQSKELEELLNAKIATPSDPKALQAFVHRPKEYVMRYNPPNGALQGELSKSLQVRCSHLKDFKRLFAEARVQAEELGIWCGEAFWSFAFSVQQAKRMAAMADRRFAMQNSNPRDSGGLPSFPRGVEHDQEIQALEEANQYVQNYEMPVPTAQNASSKVIQLYNGLRRQFERSGDSRVLVFVERRSTAMLLHAYFSKVQPSLQNLRCGFLVGNGTSKDSCLPDLPTNQATLLMNFRKGTINCIFATSAAEEGLDIQDCNVVIRFDPVKTMIQYIQSRGRARHRDSQLFHMVEIGNSPMLTQVSQVTQSAEIMVEFSKLVPSDRILQGLEEDSGDMTRMQYPKLPTLMLPQGAKLTFDFALVVLAHFVGCIPHDPEDDMSLAYVMSREQDQFECEVILPAGSPIKSVTGERYPRKSLAKRSAAFEACRLLQREGYLDENLLPIYAKRLPALRNARLAIKSGNSTAYNVNSKPKSWLQGRGEVTSEYYLTVIDLAQPWQTPTRPLGLLTRQCLPDLPSFPIFRIDGSSCQVLTFSFKRSISMAEQTTRLTGFTLQVLHDVFNKTFERDDLQMSYWLAPLKPMGTAQPSQSGNGFELIDWDLALEVDTKPPQSWSSETPHEDFLNKFVIDPFHGGRRYCTVALAPTLRPQDAVPSDGFRHSSRVDSILNNSSSLWKKTALKSTWDKGQPVYVADFVSHRLNVLAAPDSEEEKSTTTKTYICLEPLKISSLPVDLAAMATIFPGIITRLESYLIALELRDSLELDITPELMLEAITKDSDVSDDWDAEPINFQRGMGPNYERLEFIGDTFLKMSTTVAVYARHTAKDEFQMHVDRMHMLCNANLMKHAKREGHHAYIRGQAFSRRTWYPELKLLKGKAVGKEINKLHLSDKTIADVCEAIIGAALIANFDEEVSDSARFDNAVRAVSIFVQDSNHQMLTWQDHKELRSAHSPKYITDTPTAAQRHLVHALAKEHGYHFKSARLARSAFSHSSYPRSWEPGIPSYERLEFLGDALLDMASVLHLWRAFGEKRDPQWLTEHKMAMASNKFLGVLCVRLGFYKHIRYTHAALETAIRHYVTEVNELEAEHGSERNYWMLAREPPKCLADVVESYVGAMFVDSDFSFGEVLRFFQEHIRWFFEDMELYDTFANNHPIAKLQQFMGEIIGCHEYRLMAQEMPSSDGMTTRALAGLMVHSKVVSRGHAGSMKNAKTLAASTFLKRELGTTPYEFRQKFKCTCNKDKQGDADVEMT